MRLSTYNELPPPPPGKTGWPWTGILLSPVLESERTDDWPIITLVTPSYNQGIYVEETIRSILLQGYPRLEYIVMDGGSGDGTVAILEKYAPWITHWESRRDQGQCDAINRGFGRGTGQILGWINSDDLLLPGALFKLAAHATAWTALTDRNRPALVVGTGYLCDEQGAPLRLFSPLDAVPLVRDIRFADPLLQPATFFTRQLWEELGPFDLALNWTFDWELWIRAVAGGAVVRCLPEFLAAAHQHEAQKTETGAEARYAEMRKMLLRNAGGEEDFASLLEIVNGLRPWFSWLRGFRLRNYGRGLATVVLRWRFPRFTRGQIRDLMYNFGM